MGRIPYLRAMLTQVHDDLDSSRKRGSWTAVERLSRLAVTIRDELDEEATDTSVDLSEMSAEEARAHLVDFFRALSQEHLDLAMEQWCARSQAHGVVDEGRVIVVAS